MQDFIVEEEGEKDDDEEEAVGARKPVGRRIALSDEDD